MVGSQVVPLEDQGIPQAEDFAGSAEVATYHFAPNRQTELPRLGLSWKQNTFWIDHLRTGDAHLSVLLSKVEVAMHPMVLGELACGNLQDRQTLMVLWRNLPQLTVVTDAEALNFLDQNRCWGCGIGYIDLHLLAAVALSAQVSLWTRDKRLRKIAQRLGLAYLET